MSTWAPPAAPSVEDINSVCSEQEDMLLDLHIIHCLETSLEKRREEASNAEAPMPMGLGTSCFRKPDRLDPAAGGMHEDREDDEMDEMDGEDLASDELSDDAVLGMMEDAEDGDGMTDGSDIVSEEDDDHNLAGYL